MQNKVTLSKAAELATILGVIAIVIGVAQYFSSENDKKYQRSLDAIKVTKSMEFIRSFNCVEFIAPVFCDSIKRLKALKAAYNIDDYNQANIMFVDNCRYLIKTYDNIVAVYFSEWGDKDLIRRHITYELRLLINAISRMPCVRLDPVAWMRILKMSDDIIERFQYQKEGMYE